MTSPMTQSELILYLRENRDAILAEWAEFLRFSSISADPAFREPCHQCASWVLRTLERMEFRAELLPTSGLPLVYGELLGDPTLPRVLVYGHYDVQPPDPLELWKSPPYEPELREGRVWARGAADDKGPVLFMLKAVEVLRQRGLLRNTIRVLIEGEEESGSPGLSASVEHYRDRVQADVLLVSDTGAPSLDRGFVTAGLRGLAAIEFRLHGPRADIHSGVFGGIVRNPAIELSKIIASCFDSAGRVAVEGFYDGFIEPSESLRTAAEEGVLLTSEQIEQILGVPPTGGEQGRGIGERRGLRPTLEVNGLFSGYTGHGNKTIIPQSASVKFSARLVPNQDPRRTLDALVAHVTARVPEGMRLEIVHSEDTGGALRIDPDGRFIRTARAVLAELHGTPAALVWEGGSVPVLGRLVAISGAEPVLVGYSLPSDNFHSPNESFGLDQAERVFTFTAAFLQELGRQ